METNLFHLLTSTGNYGFDVLVRIFTLDCLVFLFICLLLFLLPIVPFSSVLQFCGYFVRLAVFDLREFNA